MTTTIIVKLQLEGFHYWEDAPEPVEFLRDLHRHIFWFECHKQVSHDDRDIEIILFKRSVMEYLQEKYSERDGINTLLFQGMSCEMIAKDLLLRFNLSSCTVLEDNENGATVSRS